MDDKPQPTIEEMVKLCSQLGDRVVAYQQMLNDAVDTLREIADSPEAKKSPELRADIAMAAFQLMAKLNELPELEVPDALVL